MIKFDKFIQGINNKDPRAWKELYRFYYGALCNGLEIGFVFPRH